MKKVIKFLTAALFGAAAAVLLCVTAPAKQAEAAVLTTPMQGVDVSSYQGDIDWNQVAASGITFAMVRVGNTTYGLDTNFAQNVIGATQAGIRVGAYVYSYATTPEEAAADAAFAVNAMAGYPITFPVAFDIEAKAQQSLSPETQASIVDTFCNIIENAGYTAIVYTNKNWFESRLAPVAWDHWVAQYSDSCTYANHTYTMWQASSKGSVAGISGNVDIDYLYEDYYSEIIPEGQVTVDGLTYNYSGWLKTNGFRTVDGVTYFYDVNGNIVKDQTVTADDGTIIRMCKDGHVVRVTAEMQQYVQTTQTNLQNATQALADAQATLAQAQATYDAAEAAYAPYEAQVQAAYQAAADAAAAYQADPTNADLAQQAVDTAALYQQVLSLEPVQAYSSAQTALTNAQNDVNTKAQAVTTAQSEATIAAAAATIPD